MMKIFRKMPRWAVLIFGIVGIVALCIGASRLSLRLGRHNLVQRSLASDCHGDLATLFLAKRRVEQQKVLPVGGKISVEELRSIAPDPSRGPVRFTCPKTGQEYVIGPVGSFPTCPSGIKGHELNAKYDKF